MSSRLRSVSSACCNRIWILVVALLVAAYFAVLLKDSQSFLEFIADNKNKRTSNAAKELTTTTAVLPPLLANSRLQRLEAFCSNHRHNDLDNTAADDAPDNNVCHIPGVAVTSPSPHAPPLSEDVLLVTVRHPFSRLADAYARYLETAEVNNDGAGAAFIRQVTHVTTVSH